MSTPCCIPLFHTRLLFHPILKPYKIRYSISTTLIRSSISDDHEREEARWLREEQRWLREEQRWLREESAWNAQRDSLMQEISVLKEMRESQGNYSVKPMQASLGAPEVIIMTDELEETLYIEHEVEYSSTELKEDPKTAAVLKEATNGAAVASVTEISEIQHEILADKGGAEFDITKHRVFLLGENRWEEPSRLFESKGSITKCICCRGEGRMLCAECDGSGEPNVEEQFLEWADEKMKCPYCNGVGFATCDLCDGNRLASVG